MFKPMLSTSLNRNKLIRHVEDDQFWMERKLDGQRVVVTVENNAVTANGRVNETTVARDVQALLSKLNGRWVLDCELVAGVLWVFDLMVETGNVAITEKSPYSDRRNALDAIASTLTTDRIRVLPTCRTTLEKAALVKEAIEQHWEGIMVKDLAGPYMQGKRSHKLLKCKFTETAEIVVTEVGRQGKRSIAMGVYSNGTLIDIGACTVSDRQLATLQVGTIAEVRYLYMTEDNRLYQPAFLKIRTDKQPEECVLGQFKHTNKKVDHA